jgi:hypothetical protein
VHTIARIQGADGGEVAVGVDCDGVTVRAGTAVILGHSEREDFSRAYFEAVRQADEWVQRYGGDVPP